MKLTVKQHFLNNWNTGGLVLKCKKIKQKPFTEWLHYSTSGVIQALRYQIEATIFTPLTHIWACAPNTCEHFQFSSYSEDFWPQKTVYKNTSANQFWDLGASGDLYGAAGRHFYVILLSSAPVRENAARNVLWTTKQGAEWIMAGFSCCGWPYPLRLIIRQGGQKHEIANKTRDYDPKIKRKD